jgi:hypothetical protein
MSKKLLIPLLAIAAIAVLPVAAAQAEPHWYSNNIKLAAGTPVYNIAWGTISLEGNGVITCHNSAISTIENPSSGTAGVDSIESFNPTDCVSASCPGSMVLTAEGLPWLTLLEEEAGVLRDHVAGVKVRAKCTIPGVGVVVNTVYEGELKPQTVNGTSATKPSFDEFGPGSGELVSAELGNGKNTGKNKVQGYEKQELITVKNP